MEKYKLTREIPVEDGYDIVVAGGGIGYGEIGRQSAVSRGSGLPGRYGDIGASHGLCSHGQR
jgi:hypothetical protein